MEQGCPRLAKPRSRWSPSREQVFGNHLYVRARERAMRAGAHSGELRVLEALDKGLVDRAKLHTALIAELERAPGEPAAWESKVFKELKDAKDHGKDKGKDKDKGKTAAKPTSRPGDDYQFPFSRALNKILAEFCYGIVN